jgi:hypothetical protein
MTSTEYLIIFESLIYGIVVTQIILGWGKMIQHRREFKVYWAYIGFTIAMFLTAVQNFYSSQDAAHYSLVFNSLTFLIFVLMQPTVISIITGIIMPDSFENLDLREHIKAEFAPIATAFGAFFAVQIPSNILQHGPEPLFFVPHVILSVIFISFWITKKLWIFELLVILMLIVDFVFLWLR